MLHCILVIVKYTTHIGRQSGGPARAVDVSYIDLPLGGDKLHKVQRSCNKTNLAVS